MKTIYKNNLQQAFLILETEEEEGDSYGMDMLRENEIPGLLRGALRYSDGVQQYYYDISGKTSFQTLYQKGNLQEKDIRSLIRALLKAIRQAKKYMLAENCILLKPEYIFCEKEEFYFCYYPPCTLNCTEEFHKLTEFFVQEIGYHDEKGIHLAYSLHKKTMEEHYSIERIMKELEQEEEQVEIVTIDYSEKIEEAVQKETKINEKTELWEPIRRLLEKRKKGKQEWWNRTNIEEDIL